jgi:hypothetical protein
VPDPPETLEPQKARTNRLIDWHAGISKAMTAERTSLESKLIPVTAYIVISALECWYRHPEMVRTIDAAMPGQEIGAAARRPGCRVNAVHLWSAANIYLLGRKVLSAFGLADDEVERTWIVLDFWERVARAYRNDGEAFAWDAGFVLRPYDAGVIGALVDGAKPVAGAEDRARIKRFNATVINYLFLLYFDTRVGTGDSGPYPLPDGRVLLVRDFYQLAESDFAWSHVARDVPYRNLTAALVLDRVDVRVNDWGTSVTDPEDYLDRLVGFGLFTTDTPDGSLRAVPLDELDGIVAAVRTAQTAHYRNVAAMTRDAKIACGAYVYFSFLRPFAEVAGVAGALDWTVPRDTLGPVYDAMSQFEGTNEAPDEEEHYYAPIA